MWKEKVKKLKKILNYIFFSFMDIIYNIWYLPLINFFEDCDKLRKEVYSRCPEEIDLIIILIIIDFFFIIFALILAFLIFVLPVCWFFSAIVILDLIKYWDIYTIFQFLYSLCFFCFLFYIKRKKKK